MLLVYPVWPPCALRIVKLRALWPRHMVMRSSAQGEVPSILQEMSPANCASTTSMLLLTIHIPDTPTKTHPRPHRSPHPRTSSTKGSVALFDPPEQTPPPKQHRLKRIPDLLLTPPELLILLLTPSLLILLLLRRRCRRRRRVFLLRRRWH